MKRVLLGAALVVLFVSCAKSPEEKAKSLIEDDIKKVLYHPESYDPAETLVDSAFAPFDDPVFYEKTLRLCKLGMAIDRCDENMKDAKSSMSFGADLIKVLLEEIIIKKQNINMTIMRKKR